MGSKMDRSKAQRARQLADWFRARACETECREYDELMRATARSLEFEAMQFEAVHAYA